MMSISVMDFEKSFELLVTKRVAPCADRGGEVHRVRGTQSVRGSKRRCQLRRCLVDREQFETTQYGSQLGELVVRLVSKRLRQQLWQQQN